MIKRRNRKKGQALMEAIVVLPILILIIWGIYRAHAVAFLSARAEIAARHAAWVGSVDESDNIILSVGGDTIDKEDAQKAGEDILLRNESGMTDTVSAFSGSMIKVEPASLWVSEFVENAAGDNDFSITDYINIGVDIVEAILSALPIFRPFVQNSYAVVDLKIDSFGFDYKNRIRTHAYFANRWDSLYFKSIWDFLNVSLLGVLGDLNDVMDDANEMIEDAADKMDEFAGDGEFPEGTPYSYEDFEEYLDAWRRLFSNW